MAPTNQGVESHPARIGRYRITAWLGSGPAGVVYHACDDDLQRDVAIKVPDQQLFRTPHEVVDYLSRARQVAAFDHPGIVPLYDAGTTADGSCYLVMKLVTGGSLADHERRAKLSAGRAVRLAASAAEALHQAHRHGIVHANIKPSNLFVDGEAQALVADFGQPLRGSTDKYTAAYLSPEQLRGETHRIDARADVYSLGVVLYELLAGHLPHCSSTSSDSPDELLGPEPPSLGELAPSLPPELVRVCHKAIARRVSDRYTTAMDLAEDLRGCLASLSSVHEQTDTRVSTTTPAGSVAALRTVTDGAQAIAADGVENVPRVVPKGLRSFDHEDAEFFLELLPGPHGRDGLPESLRFWKARLEETDAEKTFSVGLIYGPSGCGKSSLVKAGLTPRLASHVEYLYLEATPDGTEPRLLKALRKRYPALGTDLPLPESLAEIRRGRAVPAHHKLVIILDQFEQWLHGNRDVESPELSRALRQCNGGRVQCVVLVRDDFWMAVTRFMHDLEIQLVEGQNSAAVDLFSPQHARKVLIAFGRAFGCLPEREADLSAAENDFLQQAIAGLGTDGKVISVQLALFAEMVKNKIWVPATLREVGGAEGIGLGFLEETFSALHAPPQYRRHQRAVRAVLRALLPESGTNIKGRMHSREELLAAAGYTDRAAEFGELLQILDKELRLVTPADPEGNEESGGRKDEGESESQASDPSSHDPRSLSLDRHPVSVRYYQLTHDFLVPSVRRWLVRKQQETRRGRAELLLEDKASTWQSRPERRYLPAWWQWLTILWLTRRRDWSAGQRSLMRAAARHHLLRGTSLVGVLLLISWAGYEWAHQLYAQSLRDRVLFAETANVAGMIRDLMPYRRWVDPLLRAEIVSAGAASREALHARLALLPRDATQAEPIADRALVVADGDFPVVAQALAPHAPSLTNRLWNIVSNEQATGGERLRAALLLARLAPPGQGHNNGPWQANANNIARQLHAAVVVDPTRFGSLVSAIAPARELLIDPLMTVFRDARRGDSEKSIAANLVAEFASDRPKILVELLLEPGSTARQATILARLAQLRDQVLPLLEPLVDAGLVEPEPKWNTSVQNFATADASAVQSIEAAGGMVSERFAFCPALPWDAVLPTVEALRGGGYRPIQVRPYRTGDSVQAAVLWSRDGRNFSIQHDLDESALRQQIAPAKLQAAVLTDVAAYDDPKKGGRFAAVWSPRQPGDPETTTYLGPWNDLWKEFSSTQTQNGFGLRSQAFALGRRNAHTVAAVFWKGAATRASELTTLTRFEADLAGPFADELQVGVTLTRVPYTTPAESWRSQIEIEFEHHNDLVKTNPQALGSVYGRGYQHDRLRQNAQAIDDYTKFLDAGSETAASQSWMIDSSRVHRVIAAARLGRRADAQRLLSEYVSKHTNDEYRKRWLTASVNLFLDDPHRTVEEFEEFNRQWPGASWSAEHRAYVLALAAEAVAATDGERSQEYAKRAVDNLEMRSRSPNPSVWFFRNNTIFEGLRDDPRMRNMHIELELDEVAALRYARRGQAEAARRELAGYLRSQSDANLRLRTEVLTSAFLGDDEQASRQLDAAVDTPQVDEKLLWQAACACSLMAWHAKVQNPDRAQGYSNRAIEFLRQRARTAAGAVPVWLRRDMLTSWELYPLHGQLGFEQLIRELSVAWSFAASTSAEFESQCVFGLDPQEHFERARQLSSQGFRPVSVSACALTNVDRPQVASVWQRPVTTEQDRDQQAARLAVAAAALVRLGKPDRVWPLLRQSSNPRVRTEVLHLLGPLGVDPSELARRVAQEQDSSIRRALVMALGEAQVDILDPTGREALVNQILDLFRRDRDPGVHSAAEWLLNRLGQHERVAAARLELSAAKTDVVPAWSESLLGTTLVRVAGPVEIQMGSPARELDRLADEAQTRRRIPRTFAISTKEVTVEQFEKFKQAHPEIAHSVRRSHSPMTSCPVGSLSLYQAMQFCRWLSEQEGLVEDEMCYPPIHEIGPRLEVKPYMFSRSGYRLPTEAEWEYAARSGADTPRFFGYAPDKLPKYAWTKETANGRSWPVATLLPNELGLFDVYGNAEELCHQRSDSATSNDRETRDDVLMVQAFGRLTASRGGSSLHPAAVARSAARNPGKTTDNPAAPGPPHIGFRVVRTVSPADLSAARALRRQGIALRAEGKLDDATGVLERAGAGYERLVGAHPDVHDYAWELADFLLDAAAGWVLLERVEATSQNGTTLTRLRDNSILASGKLPETDLYTVLGETHLPSIVGIKLEAMPDSSLPKGGPGRSPNGAFTVHIEPMSVWVVGENDRSLSFHRAFASGKWFFKPSQGGMGTSPDAGQTHVLAMEADSAAPLATGDRIRIVLNQSYPHSSLGRFRIWVTANPRAGSVEYWRFNLDRSSLSGPARLGCAYAALGRAESALAALVQAGPTPAADSPRDAFLLALANRAIGRNDDAQRWLARGLARWDQGNADRALMRLAADAMEIATDRAPDDLELLARRARLLYESEDLAFAQAFVPLIERHRNDPTPLIARGRLYSEYPKQSTMDLADADFKQAAELASDELHRFVDAGWWVIGPFPPELAAVQAPESNPDPSQPVKLGSQTLHWRQAAPDLWGKIDLKSIFAADGRSAYALTYIYSPNERTATLLIAADDNARLWLNGTLVHEVTAIRDVRENPERVPVFLKQGRNVLLAKVTNGFGHHFLGVRLADSPHDRGLSMAELGLWDEAARLWKRGLSRIPDGDLQPTDLYRLAAVLLAAKDRDSYRRICAQFFERFAQSPDPTPRMQLAYTAGLSSDSGITGLQLVDLIEGVPTDEPREAWRQVARAQALYRADRPGDALAILEQLDSAAEEWARAWSKAWLLRALCHHAQGRTTEATQWLDKAEALYAAAVGATLAAAEFKLPEQYWEFASVQILYREALAAIRPDRAVDEHQVALQKRAREWLAQRDRLTADFDDAVRLTPERPEVWLARARRNVTLDRSQQAAEDYLKALSLKSDNAAARNELHTLMARLGDQFNSDKPDAWHERGRMFLALGQVEQAITAFGKALDLFPDTSAWDQPRSRAVDEYAKNAAVTDELLRRRPDDTHLRLGIARRKVIDRQWRSAVADYAAIIYQRPPGHEAFEYAALLLLTGDGEGYQKFVRWMFDQIDDEPKPSVAYFWAHTATLTAEPIVDSRRVVALAQRAVDSENNWYFPRTLAAALNQSGDLAAALVQLDSATQTGGQSKFDLAFKAFYRGLFMLQAGRMKEARESLDQALATLPAASAIANSRPAAGIELTLRRRQLELPLLAAEIAELTAALAQPTQDRAKLLGRRDAMQARREEIAAGFSAPLEYKPDEPQYWLARGRQFVELEQTEQALANYEQALDRFPESADWRSPHSRLVHECAKNADVMTSLLARRPNDSHLRLGRARRRLIDRQWRAALTDYAALIDGQAAGDLWLTSAAEYAGLLWLTGNRDGHRDVLRRMIERTGENPSPESAYVLAITAGAADSGVEPNRIVAWARQAVDAQENARRAFGLALALYRAGDDAAVLRRLEATPGVGGWGNVDEVWNELVRAGVMLRTGRAKDGQQWLDRAVSHLPAVTTPGSEAAHISVALQAFKFRETGNAFGFNEAKRQLFFWRNGAADATVRVPADGDYEIVVQASCDSAQNEHAKFKIHVDGEPVGKETLLTTALAKEYTLTANIKAGDRILVVEFTNDISKQNEITKKNEYDRNFYLHAVTLRPKVSQEFGPGDWLITQMLRREIESPVLAAGIAELTTELEQQPQNQNDLLRRRADLYTRRRDWSSAADDVRRLVDGKPDDPDLLHRRGTALAHARRWREAGDDFVKLNRIKPTAAIHGICPAALYLEARNVGGYLRLCRELVEQARHTSDPMVAERTSKACLVTPLAADLSSDVLALATAAVTINPRHELMSYFECNRGLAAYRTGDYSAAVVWCQRCLESDKKSPVWFRTADANLVIAMSLHRLGRNDEARQALSRGIELLEKQTESNEQENWLGDGWFDWIITSFLRREAEELLAGRDALAAYLDDAVRLLPEQPDVWHERGRLRLKLGQMEQAVADFDKALDLFPDDPSWTAPRSQAVHKYAERDEVLTALTARRPNDAHLRLGRGRRLIHAGQWREALAEYAAVIVKRSPSDEWMEYSALLLLTGDREGYREFTTQSARLLGSSPAPDIAYFLARCASLAPEPAIEPQRAVDWARQAVNAVPTNSLYRHTLGLALYRAGDDGAAMRELDESRTQGSEGAAMHVKTDLVLAMVHWRQGRTEFARERLERAIKNIPADPSKEWPFEYLVVQLLRREAEETLAK